jgi:hypothetical protein
MSNSGFMSGETRGAVRQPQIAPPRPGNGGGIPEDLLGAPGGVATLDGSGKLPSAQNSVTPGDGLVCVGGEFRLAVDHLPAA